MWTAIKRSAAILAVGFISSVVMAGDQTDGKKPIDPKLLGQLAAELDAKDFEEQTAALGALDRLLPGKADQGTDYGPVIEPLFRRAGWGGIARRNARLAEDLLVRIGKPSLPLLHQRLQSADAHDRRVAADLVARIGPLDAALAARLRQLLADRDHHVRRAAIEGLELIGAPAKDAIRDLEAHANLSLNHFERVSARVALIRIAGASEARAQALADLVEPMIYLDEPMAKGRKTGLDYEAARFATSELGRLGLEAKTVARELLAALKHADAGIRVNAASALGNFGATTPETVAALIARLQDDPHRGVRRAAAGSLGKIGPNAKTAIPALQAALKGDGQGGWWIAADALGKIGGPETVPALIEALANPDDDIRYTAARSLGNLGAVAKAALPALESAGKTDPREANRTAATDAVRKIERDRDAAAKKPPS